MLVLNYTIQVGVSTQCFPLSVSLFLLFEVPHVQTKQILCNYINS